MYEAVAVQLRGDLCVPLDAFEITLMPANDSTVIVAWEKL